MLCLLYKNYKKHKTLLKSNVLRVKEKKNKRISLLFNNKQFPTDRQHNKFRFLNFLFVPINTGMDSK